jgi:two-component system nitrogen regulation sensor histidine kinase GlnL
MLDWKCGSIFALKYGMPMPEHSIAQMILDNLHSSVLVINESMSIECMNPSAENLFQISNNRAHGRSIKDLLPGELEFYERLEQSMITDHPYTEYQVSLNLYADRKLTVDYTVSPLKYQSGGKYLLLEFISLGRYMKISQDTSLLSQHDASKSLLRGLAHEIKNPLGGLRGAAQLLERELDSEDNKQLTGIIIHEADRLQNLVDRMLGPKNLPSKKKLNIHRILTHIRQLVQAENETIRFIADYDPSLPRLLADETMLIQAILNITRNAVAALHGTGVIIFRTRSQRNCAIGKHNYSLVLKLDIIDHGDGIPEEMQQKIFFPMITGRSDGTGLGLSIAQSLIQQHNGLIECASTPDETRFTILIPLENGND